MFSFLRWCAIRVFAGVALLLCSQDLRANPTQTVRPPVLTPDQLAAPDTASFHVGDSPAAAYRIYFRGRLPSIFDLPARLRVSSPPPPGEMTSQSQPIWTYRKGTWVLAAGGSAAGTGAGIPFTLLKEVDEPAAFCLMGTGLILMVVGPRQRKKRAIERLRASRLPRRF